MPIQYYDSVWFNNRPSQARAKIAPKQIVVFAPGSTDFFSRRGENTLSVEQLTDKYGKTVFAEYDLNFVEADDDTKADETADADDEGDGDSIDSKDSDEDPDLSDAASMASFISDHDASDNEQDDGMYGEDEDASGEDDAGEDGATQFADEYDIDMEQQEKMAALFDEDSALDL
jgi:hypothetical protein